MFIMLIVLKLGSFFFVSFNSNEFCKFPMRAPLFCGGCLVLSVKQKTMQKTSRNFFFNAVAKYIAPRKTQRYTPYLFNVFFRRRTG